MALIEEYRFEQNLRRKGFLPNSTSSISVNPSGTPDSLPVTVKLTEQVVDHKWTIPNFLPVISATRNHFETSLTSLGRFPFLIGTDPGNPTLHWPLKVEASLHCFRTTKPKATFVWMSLNLLDRPLHPLCSVAIHFEFLNIVSCSQGTSILMDEAMLNTEDFDWSVSDFMAPLFKKWESESLVDKQGALHIHFKLKVNITRPRDVQPAPFDCFDFQSCESQIQMDLEAMFNDTTTSDFQVKVTGKETKTFYCHKVILAARTPIFRAMLESKTEESQENVLKVDDIPPKAMSHFLSFLYAGRFKHSSWIKSLPKLLYAADKYCFQSLKDLCDVHLMQSVTCKNAMALAKLAEKLQLTQKTQSDIRKFITENVEKVTSDSCDDSEDEED